MTETTAQQHNLALSHHTKGKEQARVTLENTSVKKRKQQQQQKTKPREKRAGRKCQKENHGLKKPMI